MSLPVSFKRTAIADLRAARAWYEEVRVGLGDELVAEVDRVLAAIQRMPRLNPIVVADVRVASTNRFPYLVAYRLAPEAIKVLAIYHNRSAIENWSDRIRASIPPVELGPNQIPAAGLRKSRGAAPPPCAGHAARLSWWCE